MEIWEVIIVSDNSMRYFRLYVTLGESCLKGKTP